LQIVFLPLPTAITGWGWRSSHPGSDGTSSIGKTTYVLSLICHPRIRRTCASILDASPSGCQVCHGDDIASHQYDLADAGLIIEEARDRFRRDTGHFDIPLDESPNAVGFVA
jgi:hypothetical protein